MIQRADPSEVSQIVDTENRDYAAESRQLRELAMRSEGVTVTSMEEVADIMQEHKTARIAIMGGGSHPGMAAALLRSIRARGLNNMILIDPLHEHEVHRTVQDLKLADEIGQGIPPQWPEFAIRPYDDKRMRQKPAPVVKEFTEQDQQRLDAAAAKRARKAAKLRSK